MAFNVLGAMNANQTTKPARLPDLQQDLQVLNDTIIETKT